MLFKLSSILTFFVFLFSPTINLKAEEGGDYQDIKTQKQWESLLAKAKENGKPIVVKIEGSDWCGPCKALSKSVFKADDFKTEIMPQINLAIVDMYRNKKMSAEENAVKRMILSAYGKLSYPTVLFLSPEGKELKRIKGFSAKKRGAWMKAMRTYTQKAKDGEFEAMGKAPNFADMKFLEHFVSAKNKDDLLSHSKALLEMFNKGEMPKSPATTHKMFQYILYYAQNQKDFDSCDKILDACEKFVSENKGNPKLNINVENLRKNIEKAKAEAAESTKEQSNEEN